MCACVFACVRACEKERERRFLACILSDRKCLTEVIHGEFRRIGSEEARRSRPRRREERRGKTHTVGNRCEGEEEKEADS